MERQSIAMLKKQLANGQLDSYTINALRKDERKGVKQIIEKYERQQHKAQQLEENFLQMCRYEQQGYTNGLNYIAGIDEAGRGPLAGPVVAAAVILPKEFKLLGLNDSKQLNERIRNEYFMFIKKYAISYGISVIDNQTIDRMNIYKATQLAMQKAINQLNPFPDHVLIDAVPLKGLRCSSEAIIKGDAKSISIAAASILAKVTRDNLMKELHNKYPMYDFSANMGYGTKNHLEMLKQHGVSPYHRMSYAPVRQAAD